MELCFFRDLFLGRVLLAGYRVFRNGKQALHVLALLKKPRQIGKEKHVHCVPGVFQLAYMTYSDIMFLFYRKH